MTITIYSHHFLSQKTLRSKDLKVKNSSQSLRNAVQYKGLFIQTWRALLSIDCIDSSS